MTIGDARRARRAASTTRARDPRAAHDDQADAHVERAEHLVASRSPPRCCNAAETAAAPSTRAGSIAARAALRQHARQILGDAAAGDVRHALDAAARRAAAATARRYDRCGASSASPTRRAELRHERVGRQARPRRTARAAPANSRWCAGRPTAGRSARRPARSRARRSTLRLLDDADDEAGDVVFAVGVEARHLRGLAAEQRAAVLAARRAPCRRRPARRRPATAGRSPGSRERTAARAPCTRMSLTQWLTRSAPTVSCRPVMNATFSLVPTPSALDTSTGSR